MVAQYHQSEVVSVCFGFRLQASSLQPWFSESATAVFFTFKLSCFLRLYWKLQAFKAIVVIMFEIKIKRLQEMKDLMKVSDH